MLIAQGELGKGSNGLKKIFIADTAGFELFKKRVSVVLGEKFIELGHTQSAESLCSELIIQVEEDTSQVEYDVPDILHEGGL